jgi:hypothetical protein
VDIRSLRDKESGAPDLPNAGEPLRDCATQKVGGNQRIALLRIALSAPRHVSYTHPHPNNPTPTPGKLIELEYAAIVDRRVRNQLRNATDLEVKVGGCAVSETLDTGLWCGPLGVREELPGGACEEAFLSSCQPATSEWQ